MKAPKVSVIIPVYNGEKKLYRCLNTVLQQTYRNYEIIVVNNNSTDRTQKIIDDFKEKSSKITSVFEPYKSRGAARNKGIEKAKGEIIAMIDADCVAPKNWITELTKPIIEENENAVVGFEEDLIENFWTRARQEEDWIFLNGISKKNYLNHIDTKNFAIKTTLIKKILFNRRIGNLEDVELYLRLRKISKIRFHPKARVGHYHPSSFWEFVTKQFNRGYWVKKIYDLHKNEKDITKHIMFGQIPRESWIQCPKNMYNLWVNNPSKKTLYKLIEEISWRTGILWAALSS